jgi:hypothetical protein
MAVEELPEARELSVDEFHDLLEERTQRYFNMTLAEFVIALDSGELDDDPAALDIAILLGADTGQD